MHWFFLVGFMGAGKTTLGATVSERMALPFFDLDAWIEKDVGLTVREIFKTEGERGFRERETSALRAILANEIGGVVATGGGTFTVETNRDIMSEAGISVWLDAPIDAMLARAGGAERPLWKSEADARALAQEREKDYRLAHHHLELEAESTDASAARLYELLAPYRGDS